jgi:glutaredoxin
MNKKITVYSTKTCAYCNMLKQWLDEKGIKYANYNVDKNPFAAQMMVSLSGQMGVPFTTIEDESGQVESVIGFDKPKLEALIS